MFKLNIFKKPFLPPVSPAEQGLYYKPYDLGRVEIKNLEASFTRLFLTEDGQKVLAYLQAMTFQRALGPGSDNDQLRYMEGQRSLLATILRLIDRGRGA